MEISQELLDYIEKNLNQGFKKEDIVKILIDHGWPKEVIDEAFAKVENKKQSLSDAAHKPDESIAKVRSNQNIFPKTSALFFFMIIFLSVAAVSSIFLISQKLVKDEENLNEIVEESFVIEYQKEEQSKEIERISFSEKTQIEKEDQKRIEYNYMNDEVLLQIIDEETQNWKQSPEFKESFLLKNANAS